MSSEGGVIEQEIYISAPLETVFGFLVDPGLMAHWVGALHRLEPCPGGIFQVEVSPGNVARGTFTEVTPPHRVAFTWGWDTRDPELATLPAGASLVEIELFEKDGGTLLRLRHSRLPEVATDLHRERWAVHIGRLQVVASEHDRASRGFPSGVGTKQAMKEE